jgi:PhnB protein
VTEAPARSVEGGKTMAVKPIPKGYEGANPYLCCKGAAAAIKFYKKAFGAREMGRIDAGAGKIAHAEVRIGDAVIMLADEYPQAGFLSPRTIGGTPVIVYVYVRDVDALARRAAAAGAVIKRPVADQFYGDRSVWLQDPFGHSWKFATRIEDLTPREIKRRAAKAHRSG